MDISGYLKRINYNGIVYRDLATLRELQYNHVFSIPFETLDIHNQIPILLQINFLYQKVIHDRRGGYCYELNVLFHNLLALCGFDVSMVAGRLPLSMNIRSILRGPPTAASSSTRGPILAPHFR